MPRGQYTCEKEINSGTYEQTRSRKSLLKFLIK